MFLPIGDMPNPRSTPIMTYLLIGLNVAIFLLVSLPLTARSPDLADPMLLEYLRSLGVRGGFSAQQVLAHMSAYDVFVYQYGYRPGDPSLLTLFTAMFLHGGWMHLAGNMLFLWIFGDNVEHRLGHLGFLLAYLVTGIAATLFFALFVPHSQVPLVGASGAISGVLGLYFLWFPRNQVKVFIFLFPFIMNTFLIPARLVLGFYLLADNLLPFLLSRGGEGGVAHGAHIGGFVAGVAIAWGIDRLPLWRSASSVKSASSPRDNAERSALPEQIAGHLREGNPAWAAAKYFSLASRADRLRVPTPVVLELGEYLLGSGAYPQALSLFRRVIGERPTDPQIARAYLGAGRAQLHIPRAVTSAYHYFLSALDTARNNEVADEARLHLRAIERLGEKD